ncbi:hypothetical protein SAMN05421504_11566 [Amycolatopsis xylanica]|uniref:PPE family protein n=1 Tax=Amycolatopsis xylanica TaxID=589385 RepID=A0A1H3SRU8_9PSEU|nr:hypothetical protein [Amycolatopsis xylanica]SDZ40692.1 hypothetical protein SAMN05421504_11566 [Amycolatopsis xylanica]
MTTQRTPEKTQQEVADMAPAERDAYLQRKAAEGVAEDSWMFDIIAQIKANAAARKQSQAVGDANERAATTGHDVQYVQGLQPSDANYRGNDHTQLKAFLDSNLDVEQVSNVSTAYHQVHKAFEDFSKTMTQAVNASKGEWEGSSADSAHGYFTSLAKWSDANSQNAKLASETLYDQGTAASNAKNQMPNPIPFNWNDEFKDWVTSNPFNMGENIDKSIQKQKDSQAAHEEAAGVMSKYDNELYQSASKQPAFAEPPKFGEGTGTSGDTGKDTGRSGDSSSSSGFNTGNSGNTGSSYTPGATPSAPPPVHGPGATTGAGQVAGATSASSFVPPTQNPNPGPNPNQNQNMMPMAPPMMGGGSFGPGGDNEYNSKTGRGGGFGPGSGSSSGAGAQGAGNSSGAARPGGVGAAESAAGRGLGGPGAAGRGGPAGMGGMGRGQGGKGEEDQEHQRPTYLVEGDPDDVFGSNARTAPPVIGE